jgi:hypothetical protein
LSLKNNCCCRTILVSNSVRLLQTIGWGHAESVLRYVVGGLSGMKNADSELGAYAENCERAKKAVGKLPADWAEAKGDAALTKDLLALIREEKAGESCDLVVTRLVEGKAKAGAAWDAVLLGAGEIIMSAQKNGSPLHANTVANALRYAFEASGEPETRLLILLQALAWMTRFRDSIAKWPKDHKDITALTAGKVPDKPDAAAEEILATLSGGGKPCDHPVPGWHGLARNDQPWRYEAAGKALAFAEIHPDSDALIRTAARLIAHKADGDPHRMKFPVAMVENVGWVSKGWRPHLLAAATYSFLGADAPDTVVVKQARDALRQL